MHLSHVMRKYLNLNTYGGKVALHAPALPGKEYAATADMSGGGEYPYPKYTWSPAGGWWAKTKNWQRKTGVALVVLVAAAAPLALYSSLNHVKFPAEERRKL
ncbi:hypothetical protein KRP22_008442 [Phytophthora ramorum]|nr:hypothetical protein KRP22_15193 [Phytophthora ramorum]